MGAGGTDRGGLRGPRGRYKRSHSIGSLANWAQQALGLYGNSLATPLELVQDLLEDGTGSVQSCLKNR